MSISLTSLVISISQWDTYVPLTFNTIFNINAMSCYQYINDIFQHCKAFLIVQNMNI